LCFFGDFGGWLDFMAFVSVAATVAGCSVLDLGTGFSVGVVGFFTGRFQGRTQK
jgi:hypothetical protein